MKKTSTWIIYCFLYFIFSLHYTTYGHSVKDIFEKNPEQKVNPQSTFFITPRAVKQNYRTYQPLNHSIIKMDLFTESEQHGHNFQNLGNHSTAAQPIFYVLPQQIGAYYGLNAYDVYFKHPLDIQYYRSYGSYAYFNFIMANLGSFSFDCCYSQRLGKQNNCYIGINIRNRMTEKEWPVQNDVKLVSAMPHIDLFTHIYSSNELYHLFASFSSMPYSTRESGGVRSTQSTFEFSNPDPNLRYKSAQNLLNEAYMDNKLTNDQVMHKQNRRNIFFYHHYEFTQLLQLYHEFMHERIHHVFDIEQLNANLFHFIAAPFDHTQPISFNLSNRLSSKLHLNALHNELGIKGDIYENFFYNIYYKLRHNFFYYNFPKISLKDSTKSTQNAIEQGQNQENEHYIGFHTRFSITKTLPHRFYVNGAHICSSIDHDLHQLQIIYQNNFIECTYNSVKYKVPYIVQYGFSTLRKWHEQFKQPSAKQFTAKLNCKLPWVQFLPSITYQRLHNHIFYTKKNHPIIADHCVAIPQQSNQLNALLLYDIQVNFYWFTCIHLDNHLVFFKDISNTVHKIFKDHIPHHMYTGRYYYFYKPLNKNTELEIGVNVHFKDHYYADSYDIVSQQFYRQNQFIVQGRTIMDFFINWKISHVKLSVKYSYINADFYNPNAYFVTPFYPALKQAADVSVHWSFYD